MSKLYVLEEGFGAPTNSRTDFLPVDPMNVGEVPLCNACGIPIRMRDWLPPYRVELERWDAAFGDVAFGPGGILVSALFVDAWAKANLSGLNGFYPVEVVKISNRSRHGNTRPPDYFKVTLSRSSAVIDDEASQIVRRRSAAKLCPACRSGGPESAARVVLEPTPEPTDDLFIARGLPAVRIVSERFKEFVESYGIKNAPLMPACDFRRP